MKILVIDNFDSFTYNIVHYLEALQFNVKTIRYDDFNIDIASNFEKILISPGPGHVNNYPKLFEFLKKYHKKKSIFGVCLGHQIIAKFYGYEIAQMKKVLHGKKIKINILDHDIIFSDIRNKFFAGHYHSWCVKKKPGTDIIVTSVTNDKIISSIRHKLDSVFGVQFHPESIMTEYGRKILENWIKLC